MKSWIGNAAERVKDKKPLPREAAVAASDTVAGRCAGILALSFAGALTLQPVVASAQTTSVSSDKSAAPTTQTTAGTPNTPSTGANGVAPTPLPSGSTVQIYGLLSEGVASTSNVGGSSQVRVQDSMNRAQYFGVRGTEDLGGGNYAAFALASGVTLSSGAAGSGASFWSKNAWVGLGNRQLGSFAVGRNDEFAAEQCYVSPQCDWAVIYAVRPGNLDRIAGSQVANMVKYVSPDLGNFKFRTFYAFSDNVTGTHAGRAIGLEGVYKSDSLAATVTYESLNSTTLAPASAATGIGLTRLFGTAATPTTVFTIDRKDIYTAGARYSVDKTIVYAAFSDVVLTYRGAKDSMKTYEIGATYMFTPLLSATGGCFHSTFSSSVWNTCSLSATYYFSKRTSVYVADVAQRVKGPFQNAEMFQSNGMSSGRSQNAIGAGMRHTF